MITQSPHNQSLFAFPNQKKTKKSVIKKKVSEWKMYIDGAARGNPGLAGAGLFVVDQNEKIIIKESASSGSIHLSNSFHSGLNLYIYILTGINCGIF